MRINTWIAASLLLAGAWGAGCAWAWSPAGAAPKGPPTLLAVFAHPDDEAAASPLLARYAREGVQVYLAIAADGGKGVSAHAGIPAGAQLAAVRAQEARCATDRLGIHPPLLLGFEDATLAGIEQLARLRGEVDRLLTQLRPDVVVTWGPDGGYGHPDHRMVSNVVTQVVQQRLGADGPDLFYTAVPAEGFQDFPPFATEAGPWLTREFHGTAMRFLPVRVAYQPRDLAAARTSYACHASQFRPEQMDDIFTFMRHVSGATVYLRPWYPHRGVRTDLFR